MEVGAADADRGHPHDDLVRPRLGEVDLDDLERLADRVEERGACLHGSADIIGEADAGLGPK